MRALQRRNGRLRRKCFAVLLCKTTTTESKTYAGCPISTDLWHSHMFVFVRMCVRDRENEWLEWDVHTEVRVVFFLCENACAAWVCAECSMAQMCVGGWVGAQGDRRCSSLFLIKRIRLPGQTKRKLRCSFVSWTALLQQRQALYCKISGMHNNHLCRCFYGNAYLTAIIISLKPD